MIRAELIDRVRILIDEISSGTLPIVSVGVEENNPTDTMIDGVLDESTLEVLLNAPLIRLHPTDGSSSTITPNSTDVKVGVIQLPNDFVRMVCLQMSDWAEPLYDIAIAGTPVANRQKNPYLRGGVAKPVAVLSHHSNGYSLSYYSTKSSTHSIKRLDYIAECSAEELEGSMNIDAMCWIAASKVLSIAQDMNAATAAMERAKGFLR